MADEGMTEASEKYMKNLLTILLLGVLAIMGACSKDEPKHPDGGGTVSPDATVPDPSGTITLSMFNDDETSLDGLKIGSDNNFHGYGFVIADIGAVKGLGNITSIPTEGWASQVAVIPGHGYVAVSYDYYSENPQFYRIYVIKEIGSTFGGVIGYDVKYQTPFKGLDQAISVTEKNITFPTTGGDMEVIFQNNAIIPFTVESTAEWCTVRRASTTNYTYLYDSILIHCDESTSATDSEATVIITTGYGKKTEIKVTRAAYGSVFEISSTEAYFDFNGTEKQTESIRFYTNFDLGEFEVESSETWCTASVSTSKKNGQPERHIKWVEGEEKTRAGSDMLTNYYLNITVTPYTGKESRTATVTLKHGKDAKTVSVYQSGAWFHMSENEFTVDASAQNIEVPFSTNLPYYDLKLVLDVENSTSPDGSYSSWISNNSYKDYFRLYLRENKSSKPRTDIFKVIYELKGAGEDLELGTITITQLGAELKTETLCFNNKAQNYTLSISKVGNEEIINTANWVTATPSGDNNLILRIQAATENRSTSIIIGDMLQLNVSQSKYDVGDVYSEDGVEGVISYMKDGVGVIYQEMPEYPDGIAWSTETVANFGSRSETDGEANCKSIMTIPDWKTYYPALAYVEDNLNVNGVTGWYIPAIEEVREYIVNWMNLASTRWYWTSTEKSATDQTVFYRSTGIGFSLVPKSDVTAYSSWTKQTYEMQVVSIRKFSYDFTNTKQAQKGRKVKK